MHYQLSPSFMTQNAYSITALQIADPDSFREKVRAKLTDRFTKMQMNEEAASNAALNLERGIYNYTLRESDNKNIVKKWDNGYFVQIYADRLRTVCINMGNQHVMQLLTAKQIKAHELAFMTHQDMHPDKWSELIKAKQLRDTKQKWRRPPTISRARIPSAVPPNARIISCRRDLPMNP